ncbi:hypothetical protein P1P91_08585 [Halomonas piscis]|uniref:DUF2975 domain-containing protein n=1 Tax=Halomonas piscis TaxID=3031727 RepID=A0ABY9YVV4_9GAMM|nr:hypothetical protein [Halomonas piscis]WNK18947.1 hypothetical protein P1P91_08585 [Halomonas piscis]
MLSKQITAVALRLLALWLLVKLILSLPTLSLLLQSTETLPGGDTPALFLLYHGGFLLVGLLAVWAISRAARSALARVGEAAPDETTALGRRDQALLIQLLGLYFVVSALAALPNALAFVPYVETFAWHQLLRPAGQALQLGMGLWLVAGTAFWRGLFSRLRSR